MSSLTHDHWFPHTKLHPPHISGTLLERPSLLERIYHAMLGCRLTLISAPAGSGKTTAVAVLREAHPELSLAWLMLDEDDNDLMAFLMVLLPQLIGDGLQTIEGVAELSLIQGVVPDKLLGRVNASLEVFSHGIAYPLGALLAAVVAGSIGIRGGIAIGWAGMAVSILLLVFSPLPGIRQASDAVAVEAA